MTQQFPRHFLFLPRTTPKRDFSKPPFRKSALALGLIVGFLVLLITTLVMIRIKTGPGFIRALFSRRSKRGRNGKLAKEPSSSTHSADDVASVRSTVNQRTMVLVDKELEILGLLTDPRIPPAMGQSQHQNQIHPPAPQPSSTMTTLVIPVSGQSSQSCLKPQLHLQTESCDTLSAQRYEPLTPTSPLLPPPPSLWLPLQRPSQAARPSSERGVAATRVEIEEIYTDTMTPLSPSPSHLTFATRSSGVFPCGLEPYAVDDGACPVSDRMSEDTVLVLPSPPRVIRAYGYARG